MVCLTKRPGRSKWYFKVRYPNGRWSGWRAGFTDKRATESRAEAEQARIDRGEVDLANPYADHSRRQISQHLADFVLALQGRNRSSKYVRLMQTRIETLVLEMGATTLSALNTGDAESALARLVSRNNTAHGIGLSPRTRDHYAAALREFCVWLVDAGRLPANPVAKLGRIARESDVRVERQALEPAQLHRLIEAAEVRPVQEYRRTHPQATDENLELLAANGRRRGTLYLFAALTGLRRNEVANLRWSDIDLGERPAVTARASTTKAKQRARLPIEQRLAERLKAFRQEQARLLGKVPPAAACVFAIAKNLTEQIAKDAAFAGIERIDVDGRRLDFHALRATAATMMAMAGVPMQAGQRMIRHTDARLTAKHYEKVNAEQLRASVDMVGAHFWAGAGVDPQVDPNSVPMRAAVGCSVPLADAGGAIDERSEMGQERHATPLQGNACRSVPVTEELWRRRESNPQDSRANAGLQAGGSTGGSKNLRGDGPGALIELAAAVRRTLAAGPIKLPSTLRDELQLLLERGNSATPLPIAGKLLGRRVAGHRGGRRGEE